MGQTGLLDDLYPWLVFVHVFGVLVFVLAHGASAVVWFRLRKEQSLERVAALLDASASSYLAMTIGFLAILATGLTLGFIGPWWRYAWFWSALVLLFVIGILMTPLAAIPYNKVRKALGLRRPYGRLEGAPAAPPSAGDVRAMLDAAHPVAAAIVGFGGIAVILWVMMFKPF